MNDPVIDLIAQLPSATVAQDRARRTQARCHRALQRRAPRHGVTRPRGGQLWSRSLIGLGAVYLLEAVRQAIRAYGLR